MIVITAFFLVCLAVKVIHANEECQNRISCPCGSTGENVTICAGVNAEVCTRLSKCKKCKEGSDVCSECPEGFKGPLCSEAATTTCENPGPISNGKIRFSIPDETDGSKAKMLPVDTVISYFCDKGYELEGHNSLRCKPTGLWSSKIPRCLIDRHIYCDNPGHIRNGKSHFSHPTINIRQEMKFFPLQTVREFSCNEGYQFHGQNSQTCKSNCESCTASWYYPHHGSSATCEIDCGRDLFNYGPCNLMDCNNHAPWVVSISVEKDDGVHHVCLGTLLNHHTILTTAACLAGHSTFIIRFGKHRLRNRDDNSQVMIRTTSRMILHPDFSNATFDSNIGLLFFEPRIRFTVDVQPICLEVTWNSEEDPEVGRIGIVSYTKGISKGFTDESMDLTRMTILSIEWCLQANRHANLFITKKSFCAGTEDAYQKVCEGDSGAPLFFYNRQKGRFVLLGIVSFGLRKSCDMNGNYAVFTKINNFGKWIDENLHEVV